MNEMQLTAELETAMSWLQQRRGLAPADADYWHLRHHWATVRPALCAKLLAGTWRLTPMQVVGRFEKKVLWSACDALVLKWVTSRLTPLLPVHPRCEHVKGHGGGRTSIGRLSAALAGGEYRYVFRTDIRGYYGAMNKSRVMRQLAQYVDDPVLLDLVSQYLHYTVEDGGEFHTPEKGIARGCPLSPLIGAFHLYTVDVHFAAQKNIVYARYMDDFVILAKSRWSLRRQVKALNECLASHDFEKHPDKTFVGRVEKGFDWLGAWLVGGGVTGIAPRALANHREKVRRLYERLRMWPRARAHARVSQYRRRWKIWAKALGNVVIPLLLMILTSGQATAAVGSFTPHPDANVLPCTPTLILSGDGGSGTAPSNNPFTMLMLGMESYGDSDWAGQSLRFRNSTYFDGGLWPANGDPNPKTWPGIVPSVSLCGYSVYGVKSSDGHAVLYAVVKSPAQAFGSVTGHTENDQAVASTIGGLSSASGGVTTSRQLDNPDGNTCFDKDGNSTYYAWPLSVINGLYANNTCAGNINLFQPKVDIFILWDGTLPSDPSVYDLPPGILVYRMSSHGTWNSDEVPSPYVRPKLTPARPKCSMLINGAENVSPSVELGQISPSCGGPSCGPETVVVPGATTSVSIQCTNPSSQPAQAVSPYITVTGDVNAARSNWLLKSSLGDAVTIWGTTVPGDNFGCGFKNWVSGSHDPSHGGVPYGTGKIWVPFPHDGASYGVNTPWGTTSMGAGVSAWQSKTATIQWGVCVDPSAGGLLVGSFHASATLSLVVP